MNHSETIQALKLKFVGRHAAPNLPKKSQAPEIDVNHLVSGFCIWETEIGQRLEFQGWGEVGLLNSRDLKFIPVVFGHCPRHRSG